MFNKFYKLEFGLQMTIVCLVLFFSNQLTTYTLSMANVPSTIQFNIGIILTFGLYLFQTISFYLGAKAIINYVKQTKTKNNNEQSN
jgi:protein-S-isoprenylcysteine O-methyltransferase Ste14